MVEAERAAKSGKKGKAKKAKKGKKGKKGKEGKGKGKKKKDPTVWLPVTTTLPLPRPPPSPPPPLLLTYMAAAAYACPHWTEVALWSPWNSKAAQLDSMLRLLSYVYYDLFGMTCMAYYACHLFVLSLQGPSVCTL